MASIGGGYGDWYSPQYISNPGYQNTTNTYEITWQGVTNAQQEAITLAAQQVYGITPAKPKEDESDPIVWLKKRVQETIDEVAWEDKKAA